MMEINYFPVIDMDSDGMYKAAVIRTHDKARAEDKHKAYLEEVTHGHFRLHSKSYVSKNVNISCPYCGAYLECLYEGNGRSILSVYRCRRCK